MSYGDRATIVAAIASASVLLVTFVQNKTYLVPLDYFVLSPQLTRSVQLWRLVTFALYSVDDHWLFLACVAAFFWCLRRLLKRAKAFSWLSHRSPAVQLLVFLFCSVPAAGALQLRSYGSALLFAVMLMFARAPSNGSNNNSDDDDDDDDVHQDEALLSDEELSSRRRAQQSRSRGLTVAVAALALLYVHWSADPSDTLWSLLVGAATIVAVQELLAALFAPDREAQRQQLMRDYFGGDGGDFAGRDEFFNPLAARKAPTVGYCERITPEQFEAEGRLLALSEMSKMLVDLSARDRQQRAAIARLQTTAGSRRQASQAAPQSDGEYSDLSGFDDDSDNDIASSEHNNDAAMASGGGGGGGGQEQAVVQPEQQQQTNYTRVAIKFGLLAVAAVVLINAVPVFGVLVTAGLVYRLIVANRRSSERTVKEEEE